jgi:hypothetical protein
MADERKVLFPLSFHVVLPGGTGAEDQLTSVPLKGNGKVRAWSLTADVAATGSGASRTFNLEIGTVDITGTATAVALADVDAVGETKTMGAPTALNTYRDGDTLSMEVASGGTAFTAGEVNVVVWLEPETRGI